MPDPTPSTWPPPPDLHSIQELVSQADIEGFIADGAPADEYETEADELLDAIQAWPQKDLVTERLLPELQRVWTSAFTLDDSALSQRTVKLRELAGQIERFFGPDASPQVRGA